MVLLRLLSVALLLLIAMPLWLLQVLPLLLLALMLLTGCCLETTVDLTLSSGTTAQGFIDLRPGANQAAADSVSDVVIATVPTSTTFTLQNVQAGGGSYSGTNNDRTLVIRTKNVVTVETLAAHGLLPGNAVSVSGVTNHDCKRRCWFHFDCS